MRSLEGGIDAWRGPVAGGAEDHGFFLLGEGSTPAQALAFALALEEGSRVYYAGVRDRVPPGADRELLETLVQAEERHKALLLEGAPPFAVVSSPGAGKPGESPAEWMEGVIRIDRAVAWATAPGRSTRDVLDLAMQVEANSLDLYLKLARREDLAPLRPLLERLVGEEKAHLAGLGKRLAESPA